ncbi:hypothetical protein CANCADRAFT_20709, partial [Tortispora caseinolytica NRRL Y-17796]
VIFIVRHGEGFHNVAESLYGTEDWDNYWSKLYNDGNITWGPDAMLTDKGIDQAKYAGEVWENELRKGAPIPQSFYSSPLSRSADTLRYTWPNVKAQFIENLRETYGVHTCDMRRTASYLKHRYPLWTFETKFSEDDLLWDPDVRETDEHQQHRVRTFLREVFTKDTSKYVSITAHSGTIRALLSVIGHPERTVLPGGMISVVVRARSS